MLFIFNYNLALRPQHPAAHGVLRLILEMNGEEILRADPVGLLQAIIFTCDTHVAFRSISASCIVVRKN